METIRGRKSLEIDWNEWKDRLAHYERIILDLGTGDGRYPRTLADRHPHWFVIGVDSCRENLREYSRAKLNNLLFVIASAQELPQELMGLVSHLTINFPWGSLLEGLLSGDPRLLHGLNSVSRARAALDLRLNGGALAEAGKTLEAGTDRIYYRLAACVSGDDGCRRSEKISEHMGKTSCIWTGPARNAVERSKIKTGSWSRLQLPPLINSKLITHERQFPQPLFFYQFPEHEIGSIST